MTKISSQQLNDFLAFLREAEQQSNMARADNEEANNETQDILHEIEFGGYDPRKTGRLVKKLGGVRQKRRNAKNTIEITTPILSWCSENKDVVKSLQQLLGDIRKVEHRIETRVYAPRTNILEEE